MGDKPLLSLIIGGKNDDYQEGWLSRFEFTLNYNISCLNKTGLATKVEFNFVDFFSKNKVADSILVNNTKAKVNFLETNKFQDALSGYHLGLALNSGLIKATGEHCLILGSDQFMPTASWENLLNRLDSEARHDGFQQHEQYKLIPRKQLPAQFDHKSMTFQQIDSLLDGLNFTKLEFRNFKPSLGAGAGGLLAKRKTYQAIGFFDTSWGGYGGQDNDLHNKISNLHEHTDMSQYGVFFYKLPYVSGTRLEKIKSKMEHENHAFTSIPTESRDIKKSCFISVHEERVKATLAKKHAEAITWTGVKTSIHLAIKLHSYRVFNEPLYHFWNLSKIIYDNLSMWPHADVIASSQTAVYCLPSLAKRQSLHKIHIFLDGPLNNMKHIDLFLRCILRNGHIGYARAIETDKANIKDLAPNIRLDRPTIAVMESDFLIDHWRLFIQLVNTGNILRVFVVGTLTDDIEKKIKKVLKHQQINRRISVYTATEYRYGPKNTARHFTLFFLTYRLLSSLSILIGCAKFMLRPLTRLVKKIVLDSVK